MPDAIDPSAGTTQPPSPNQAPITQSTKTPDPTSTPNPQTPIGATWGGIINVPNNFLGAGVTGKGWTITGESVVNGQRVVTLGRRIEQTGAFETYQVNGETFKAAKAYKDEQGGMSKSKKPPALKEAELGRAIDPQGELVPEFFDAATRSYRLRLPGSRTPEWVPESLILNVKQGKPDAIAKLRQAAKLDADTLTPQTTGAQLAQGVVASTILGKSLATRLGLRQEKQESSPERPSETPSPAKPKAKTKIPDAADRATKETEERQKHLEGKDAEEEEKEEEETKEESNRAVYRTNTYTAINKEGESARVRAETPNTEPGLRVATSARAPGVPGAPKFSAPLPVTIAEAPKTEMKSPSSPTETQSKEEAKQVVRSEQPKSRERRKARTSNTTEQEQPSTNNKPDVVAATLERAQARKAKKEAQTTEERFRALSRSNPEFKKLLFVDIDHTPKEARAQIMQQVLTEWDEKQHAKKVAHIEKSYSALEVNPEFRQLAYQIGLEHLQNDPHEYFRKKVQGRTIALDRNGWVLDSKTGENLGHVFSVDLSQQGGLRTEHQIKQKALQAWHVQNAKQGNSTTRLRAPRAVRAENVVRKNAPKSRAGRAVSLEGLGKITQTPKQQKEQNDIRQLREFIRGQQQDRLVPPSGQRDRAGALLGTLAGVGAFAGLGSAAVGQVPAELGVSGTTRLAAALPGLSREQALHQVSQAKNKQTARVQGLRLWLSAPNAPEGTQAASTESTTTSSEETASTSTQRSPEEEATEVETETPTSASAPKNTLATTPTIPSPTNAQSPDQESIELAEELLAAEQELAHLQAVENALEALPEGSAVPSSLPSDVAKAMTAPVTEPTETRVEDVTNTNVVPFPPVQPSQITPAPPSTETATAAKGGTRVGVPPVSQNRSSRRPQSTWSRWKNRVTLPLAFASMTNLGAAQALDQGSSQQDPREMALSADSSVPSESNDTSPIKSALTERRAPQAASEPGDAPKTTLEEARDMRAAGEQAQATQEQFSGKQPTRDTSVPQSAGQTTEPEPDGPLSPSQQTNMAARMNAAQQQDKQTQKAETPTTKTEASTKTTTQAPESSSRGRLTVVKLVWDLVEGTMDLLGFGEFLVDANTALVNDKYLRLAVGPSLKVPGASERTQRYINYSVIILDGLIAVLLLVGICLLIATIVAVTCAASVVCVVRAVT